MAQTRLRADAAQLVVVDVQEKLLPHIHAAEEVIGQCVRMMRAAVELGVPTIVTEQYPQGLGPTHPDVRAAAEGAQMFEKLAFSCCGEAVVREAIAGRERPQVLLVGIETHVCVQQTALDLLDAGMHPFVLADAVGSRRISDREVALDRMRGEGVRVTTVESAIYEMMVRSGTELFKRMLPIVR